jgi:hypothetical protein
MRYSVAFVCAALVAAAALVVATPTTIPPAAYNNADYAYRLSSLNRIQQERLYADRLATIKQVYTMVSFPLNRDILLGYTPIPDVLNENVCARVISYALRLCGKVNVAEYFYALSANNVTITATSGLIVAVHVREFNMLTIDRAASKIQYELETPNGNVLLQQNGFWRFDEEGKVLELDAVEVYDEAYFSTVLVGFNKEPDRQFVKQFLISEICTHAVDDCISQGFTSDPAQASNPNYDATQFYSNYTDCVDYLTAEKPLGNLSWVTGDNIWCRWWHSLVTSLRAGHHCPHIGKTGGDQCFEHSLEWFNTPFFPADPRRIVGRTDDL